MPRVCTRCGCGLNACLCGGMSDLPTLDELVERAWSPTLPPDTAAAHADYAQLRRDFERAGIPALLDRLTEAEDALEKLRAYANEQRKHGVGVLNLGRVLDVVDAYFEKQKDRPPPLSREAREHRQGLSYVERLVGVEEDTDERA